MSAISRARISSWLRNTFWALLVSEREKHATHLERVEWAVYKIAPDGSRVRHSEGAQTVFGLSRARRVVKELGAGWVIRHATEDTPPEE